MTDFLTNQIENIMCSSKEFDVDGASFFSDSGKNILSTIGDESEIPDEDSDVSKAVR